MSPKTPSLAVVDYGLGNLHSLARALRHVGVEDFIVTSDTAIVAAADRTILPGVGAFGDGMAGLRERGLDEAVRVFARSGKPLLGICLGMQLLLDEGAEFGVHTGLGIVPGRSVAFPRADGEAFKVPHVGWNSLSGEGWSDTPLDGLPQGAQVYFVHGFVAQPADARHILAVAHYGGAPFCAALRRDNVFGCQFHPEKSADPGLRILANFAGALQEKAR